MLASGPDWLQRDEMVPAGNNPPRLLQNIAEELQGNDEANEGAVIQEEGNIVHAYIRTDRVQFFRKEAE